MTRTAPVLAERVPVDSQPVRLPVLAPRPLMRGWALAATIAGVVAVATLVVALVIL